MATKTHKNPVVHFLWLIWPYAMILGGMIGLALPVAIDMWESYQAQTTISEIEETYDIMADDTRNALYAEAELYNGALLAGHGVEDRVVYKDQLRYPYSDMISHLSIPSLSLELPVYHGTEENTLMIGVGHLEGTTLPVGTRGGRCVLAAHSGMPNARMFDDIGSLEQGDRFVIWTLGQALAYEVIDSQTVLPEDTEVIEPVPGEDLVSLVTCTPYGINTHRLVVTGRRCAYVEDEEIVPDVEVYFNRRTIPLIIGLVIVLFLAGTGIAFRIRRRRRRKVEAKAVEEGADVRD